MKGWSVLSALALGAVVLSGCGAESDNAEPPNPGLTPGAATDARSAFGVDLQPCTKLQLDGYPTNITRPSTSYYQGPWCGRVDTAQLYVWAYARDMSAGVSQATVVANVTRDAEQLYLDLIAQGFRQVCGEVVDGQSVDVGLERAGDVNMIRVTSTGNVDSPMAPLSLIVTSSPAMNYPQVIEGGPVTPCTSGLSYPVMPTTSDEQATPAQ